MLRVSSTLRTEERAALLGVSTFLLKFNGRLHQIVWQGAITTTYTKPFYAPSMHRIVFMSDWLELYTCSKSLSLYLSGREELKGRLYKLSVQVYKSDCAYD